MTKVLNLHQIGLWRASLITTGIFAALVFTVFVQASQANAAITSQLEVGSTGSQVSQLQQFLATNARIYPEGIVSGYFGPLTQAAVTQFQVNYDIDQAGRVGPITMARMNGVMNSGLGLDISSAVIYNRTVTVGSNAVKISWNTNTQAWGKVFYSTSPLKIWEAQMNFTPSTVSGVVVQGTSAGLGQSLTLLNLQPNTTYYYLIETRDFSGNVSVTWPSWFRTN
jgi:peptidoglycan hydrolase-like protein with peptidoglycan-binding domain